MNDIERMAEKLRLAEDENARLWEFVQAVAEGRVAERGNYTSTAQWLLQTRRAPGEKA